MTPSSETAFLQLCEKMIKDSKGGFFSIATLWLKKHRIELNFQNFPIIEQWLLTYIDSWGKCDQFCYRVLKMSIFYKSDFDIFFTKWIYPDYY